MNGTGTDGAVNGSAADDARPRAYFVRYSSSAHVHSSIGWFLHFLRWDNIVETSLQIGQCPTSPGAHSVMNTDQ